MSGVATALQIRPGLLSRPPEVTYAAPMTAAPEDSALMLRYADGDLAAFEVLYRRHNDALYRYLLRLSRQREVAEDLYQEVWSNIIRTRQRYRPTAAFRTFLFRVAHNCFIDHLRRNKHYRDQGSYDEQSADHANAIADETMPRPDMETERALARKRFLAALALLPDEQRDTFLLHEEAGLDLDAIAFVTAANRETVKSRLRYATRKLKESMNAGGDNEPNDQ